MRHSLQWIELAYVQLFQRSAKVLDDIRLESILILLFCFLFLWLEDGDLQLR